jgi:hypothetical protein
VRFAFEQRLILVWLALSAITISQLGVGSFEDRGMLTPSAAITATAIGIALLKVRIIFREFMEVRHSPEWLCRLTDLWVVLTGVILLGGYFAGMAVSTG